MGKAVPQHSNPEGKTSLYQTSFYQVDKETAHKGFLCPGYSLLFLTILAVIVTGILILQPLKN